MIRKLSLAACMIAVSVASFAQKAQKVDIDKARYSYDYRDLPTSPQPADYKTFSVTLNASVNVRSNYGETGIQDQIAIAGWKKVSEAPGHLIVGLSLEDIVVTSQKVTERVDIQKDKDGKETGRKYYYRAEIGYSWYGSATVKDYKETQVGTKRVGGSEKSWASSEYSTRKEAADYGNNNIASIRNKLQTDEIKAAITEFNGWLSSSYGFPGRNDSDVLWILDSKKHTEFQAQQDTWNSFKATVGAITADNFPAETKEKLAEIIKYFDGIPAKFATDDKNDKKMRYASFYNKARIYILLENPEAAMKEADALVANAYDEGDGKRLRKEAEDLQAILKKNNATTRHFSIDLSNAVPPTK